MAGPHNHVAETGNQPFKCSSGLAPAAEGTGSNTCILYSGRIRFSHHASKICDLKESAITAPMIHLRLRSDLGSFSVIENVNAEDLSLRTQTQMYKRCSEPQCTSESCPLSNSTGYVGI